jgi:hypothetical protein
MVSIPKLGDLRHLRKLCERAAAGAHPTSLIADLYRAEQAWLNALASELRADPSEVVATLARMDIVTFDPQELRDRAVMTLRPIYKHRAAGVVAAIHDLLARHPDGAIPYTPALIRERVPGARDESSWQPPASEGANGTWSLADLLTASQRLWWTRLQRLVDEIQADPLVVPHLPTERPGPGDPDFLWSWDQPPRDPIAHGRQALLVIRYFSADQIPSRVGDFHPRGHQLAQVRQGDAWPEKEWPSRRRELIEGYVEPFIAWASAVRRLPPPLVNLHADYQREPPAIIAKLADIAYETVWYTNPIKTRFELGIEDAVWARLIDDYWLVEDGSLFGLSGPAWATSRYSADVDAILAEAIRLAIEWCKNDVQMFSIRWSDFTAPQRERPWFCLRVLGAFGVARLGVRPNTADRADVPPDSEIKLEVVDDRMMGLARCKTTRDVWSWRCAVAKSARPRASWVG